MFPQTDKSWCDYKALSQNWSYQPTLAGRAIVEFYMTVVLLGAVFLGLQTYLNIS